MGFKAVPLTLAACRGGKAAACLGFFLKEVKEREDEEYGRFVGVGNSSILSKVCG